MLKLMNDNIWRENVQKWPKAEGADPDAVAGMLTGEEVGGATLGETGEGDMPPTVRLTLIAEEVFPLRLITQTPIATLHRKDLV